LPSEVVKSLAGWSEEIGRSPDAQARLQQLGMEFDVLSGDAFLQLIHQQTDQWRKLITTLGIKVE